MMTSPSTSLLKKLPASVSKCIWVEKMIRPEREMEVIRGMEEIGTRTVEEVDREVMEW
jgi:hypothetical protein